MSRFLLVPSEAWQRNPTTELLSKSDSYFLIPTEGFHDEPRELQLPNGLNPYVELYKKIKNKNKFKKLLLQLAKTDIRRNMDGVVTDKQNILHGISFNDATLNSCNGNFFDSYEAFYCLLRRFGITF